MRLEQYWDMSYADDARTARGLRTGDPRSTSQKRCEPRRPMAVEADRVGAFLSGGTDSSAISRLLGEVLQRPARTFSIGFAEEDFNEISLRPPRRPNGFVPSITSTS